MKTLKVFDRPVRFDLSEEVLMSPFKYEIKAPEEHAKAMQARYVKVGSACENTDDVSEKAELVLIKQCRNLQNVAGLQKAAENMKSVTIQESSVMDLNVLSVCQKIQRLGLL